jgi:hypothetical protein
MAVFAFKGSQFQGTHIKYNLIYFCWQSPVLALAAGLKEYSECDFGGKLSGLQTDEKDSKSCSGHTVKNLSRPVNLQNTAQSVVEARKQYIKDSPDLLFRMLMSLVRTCEGTNLNRTADIP